MNGLFWLLLIPAVLTFGLIAWGTVRVYEGVERLIRRWIVRREMKHIVVGIAAERLQKGDAITFGEDGRIYRSRRQQELDAIATSQDRYSRRIH